MKDKYYKDIFADIELREKTVETFTNWTSTYSESNSQAEMRKAWSKIINGKEPSTPMEHTFMDIYTTRKERWQRLAEKLNINTPEGFELYRGVKGKVFVKAVVEGWKDNKSDMMQIPVHELSSWSLKRETAERFAWDQGASVVFKSYVPFERTLADKFVDDGNFITSFSHENEVVVALSEANSLAIPKNQITVTFQNNVYTYQQRNKLIKAFELTKGTTGLNPASAETILPAMNLPNPTNLSK